MAEPAAVERTDNVRLLPPRYVGHVDSVADGYVRGWARNEANPGARIVVDVYLGDRLLGSVTADMPRKDLAAAGYGDGRHGFAFALPEPARAVPAAAIGVYFHGGRIPLVRTAAIAAAEADASSERELRDTRDAVAAMRAAIDGIRTQHEAMGAAQEQLRAAVVEMEAAREAERAAVAEAALSAVGEQLADFQRRLAHMEKAAADADGFLLRVDKTLRQLATAPPPRARGAVLPILLSLFAILASGLAILAATAPGQFTGLLRPLLG